MSAVSTLVGTMPIDRRHAISTVASLAVYPLLSRSASAQEFPTKAVRIMVGFAPGGTTDVVARLLAQWLQQRLGQPFVVENRPGASTNIATEAVVGAAADGHTLLLTTTSNLLNGSLFDKLSYDFIRDIAPIAGVMRTPLVLVATPSLQIGSITEFIAYGKANPGRINMANFGIGTVSHLAAELLGMSAGINYVHVPYRGSGPMIPDLLSGRAHAAFDNLPASLEHIKSGKLVGLAVTTSTRSAALPNVPTVMEFISGFEVSAIVGVGAPKRTPSATIEKLNKEINTGLADPTLRARLDDLGGLLLNGSPTDFETLIVRETDKWGRLIKSAGIKLE